ncbi:MAG: WYL domain-containing protein [Cyanobacteria bacterium SZAS LIN-2]|nr:WYL domain-containing protein [Cyanobacteria bacterium SZAS LIN-2]MBS2007733.1 WYL domain-containing protein [Cyanobacteria bacterium SZAS TMP-1]
MSMSSTCQSSQAEIPGHDERLSDLTFVAFDVETTGLSPIACRIVELCAVKFSLDGTISETFSTLIDPGHPIPAEVSALHGITDEMVAGAPGPQEALEKFFAWLGGARPVLMAHNASFDVEFIKVEALRCGLPIPQNLVLDTLYMAQVLVSDCANYKLKTLSEHFGFGGSLYHRALDDSIYVEKLFRKLLDICGHATLAQLHSTGSVSVFGVSLQENGRQRLSPPALKTLGLLEEAIGVESRVRITYQSEFKSTRVVMPKAVIESRGSVYLNAFCLKSQADRTFRVDKIVEAVVVSQI